MELKEALRKLEDTINKEKNQLDYMLKGAKLLASILNSSDNEDGRQQNKRSEPELEKEAERKEGHAPRRKGSPA